MYPEGFDGISESRIPYCSRLKSVATSVAHNTKKACFVIQTYREGIQTYGGIQTYRGCLNMWRYPNMGASKHMGVTRYIAVVQTYRGHPNIWGVSKHTGGIQTYGECPNIGGVSKHTGEIQTYGDVQTYGGHPNIQGAFPHAFLSRKAGFATSIYHISHLMTASASICYIGSSLWLICT